MATRAPLLVVGSVNMDLLFTGLAALPRPGETVSAAHFRIAPGGKGANQAAAAGRLGGAVHLVAAIGDDDLGDQAHTALAADGVGLDHVRRVAAPTGVAAVVVDATGENSIIVTPGANAMLRGEDAAAVAAHYADTAAVVLACLEVPLDTVTAWARLARANGWTLVLNPAPAPSAPLPAELLALVDVLTPNETELASLGTVEALLEAGVGAVIVTRGGEGADLHERDGDTVHQPAFPAEPVDTTGAGDAFNGALATALAEGADLVEALAFGAAAGALSTRGFGARDGLPTRDEVAALRAS